MEVVPFNKITSPSYSDTQIWLNKTYPIGTEMIIQWNSATKACDQHMIHTHGFGVY